MNKAMFLVLLALGSVGSALGSTDSPSSYIHLLDYQNDGEHTVQPTYTSSFDGERQVIEDRLAEAPGCFKTDLDLIQSRLRTDPQIAELRSLALAKIQRGCQVSYLGTDEVRINLEDLAPTLLEAVSKTLT